VDMVPDGWQVRIPGHGSPYPLMAAPQGKLT
jgi:hypothetical protein